MATYIVFRVLGTSLEFQSRVTADNAEKAVQKLLDQQPTPPKAKSVSGSSNADYVAVPENNFNRYKTQRR